MGADVLEKGLTHDFRPASSPFRHVKHLVDRDMNSGLPKPRVRWCPPADPLAKEEVDGGFFPSTAACFGVRLVSSPVVLAEVAMPCAVLYVCTSLLSKGRASFSSSGLPCHCTPRFR